METYIFNNKLYTKEDLENVAKRKNYTFEELLQKNPSIKLSDLGNQPGVANQTANVTPLQRAVAGGYRPVGISSELQDLAPQPAPKTRAELEEEEEQRQQEIDAKLFAARKVGGITSPAIGIIDKLVPDWYENYKTKKLAGTVGGLSELARGIPEYIDGAIQAGVGNTNPTAAAYFQAMQIARTNMRGDSLEQAQYEGVIDTSAWRDFNSKLTSLNKKYFNDDGTEADFQELASQGRASEASDKLMSDVFIALPSLAVSVAGGPLGITALGVSAAGSSFERSMTENPDESIQKAFFISNIQGGIEAGSEWMGGRLLKGIGKLTKVGKGTNREIVDDLIEKTSDKFLERAFGYTKKVGAGMLFEGGTEAGANILNESLQEIAYSEDGLTIQEAGRIFTKSLNEFAVGAVLGGGTSLVTQNLNRDGKAEQNLALQIAPQVSKLKLAKLMADKDLLSNKLENAKRKKDEDKFKNQIQKKEGQIEKEKAAVVEKFNSFTKEEKRKYANVLDANQELFDDLYLNTEKTTATQKEDIKEKINNNFKSLAETFDNKGLDAKTEGIITDNFKKKDLSFEKLLSTFRNKNIKGLNVKYLRTEKEIADAAKKYKDFDKNEGIFISKQNVDKEILINVPVAEAKQTTNVLGHEKFHFLLSKFFKTDNKSIKPLVDSFKQYLRDSGLADASSKNNNILQRIEQRFNDNYVDEVTGEIEEGALEEYFTIFSDLIAQNKLDIVEEKGVANKLASAYTNTMQGLGFASVKLNTGKEVFDFIRNYTKNIQKSDKILGVKLIGDAQIQKITDSDVVIKKSKSKEIDDAYEAGTPSFGITQLYEPLVNKLVGKYKNVPDFSILREDLVQNALYEKGGVIDLVNSFDGRGKLSGYVGKLLPLRMNKMAGDLFGQKFTDDVTERVDVAATETLPEQVEREETQQQELAVAKTQEKRNILDRANLSSELQGKALTASKKILGTLLPQIDVKKGKNFREKYKIAVRNMLFDDVSNELRSFNDNDYYGYIKLNSEALYDIMPLADLTKSQALKNLFLEQQFDKDGKPVRVLESFTGKKSYAGNLVFKKKPFKEIEKAFNSEFAIKHSNQAQRKAFIINTLAKEIAFDESMEALNDPTVQEKIPLTQETAVKEFMEEFEMNIQRGRFTKYSKTLESWTKENPLVNETKLLLGLKDTKLGADPAAEFKRVYAGVIPDETLNQIVYEISQLPKVKYIKYSITKSKKEGLADEVRNNFNTDLPFKTSGTTKYTDEQVTKFVNQSKGLVDGGYVELAYLKSSGHKDKAHELMLGNLNAKEYNNFYGLDNITSQPDSRLAVATDPKARNNATSPTTRITKDNQAKANLENQKALEKQKFIINHYVGLSNAMVDGVVDKEYIAATIFHDTSGRSRNTLRRASYFLGWIPEVMETRNANYEMEHAKPFTENAIELVNAISLISPTKSKPQNQKIIQTAFNKFFSQNAIIAIPNSLQTEYLSKDATLEGGFPFSRYSDNLLDQIEFVDDTGNIDMNIFDIKYKEKLAKQADEKNDELYIKFSKTKSKPAELADMIDRKNINAKEIKSAKDLAIARRLGKREENKLYGNNWNIFLPYSAEDFYGLIQKIAGKGEQGDKDLKFLKENLLDTYSQGVSDLETDRRAMNNKYDEIRGNIDKAPFKLSTKLTQEGLKTFTTEDALRVFVWQQSKYDIPGISKTNANKLSKIVADNKDLRKFAFGLMRANKTDGYPKPETNWEGGRISTDFAQSLNQNKRPKYLKKWQNNIDLIFNDKNRTKLTAAFGPSYIKNLDMILGRMKAGVNRKPTNSEAANMTQDFINGSVGTIMSWNMRSATLQSISAINYVNWSDNNPLMVAKALGNPKQFAKDVYFLMNSDYLTSRRSGLKINIQEAEIAEAAKSKNPIKALIATGLRLGFLPTQIVDSLAISVGGSSFYRNRINTYIKKGFTQQQAEKKSYEDWRQISNESQQSADPSRISNVQASNFGRVVFAFANTPMQYTRLTKKAASDLVNGRGDPKTNISKIVYYMFVQNVIFNTLQSAYFALDFSEEDEFEGRTLTTKAKELRQDKITDKQLRIVNGMSDSVLRGMGFGGAVLSALKNTGLAYYKEKQKESQFMEDWSNVALAATDLVPPIDHKLRKLKAIVNAGKYESNVPPSVEAAINALAIANIPADRMQQKLENLQAASREDLDVWTRMALFLGWSSWDLNIEE